MANDEILIGHMYRHFKGGYYTVVGEATHSETLDPMVIYKSAKDNKLWVRPRELFLAKKMIDGREVDRFSAILPAID